MQNALNKGFMRKLTLLEAYLKKKKRQDPEISMLKQQIREMKSLKDTLSSKEATKIKQDQGLIVEALSSMKKIRIPSPS